MAKYSSSVHYKISTSLDASGITRLQAELNKLEHELTTLNKRDLIGDQAVSEALSDIRRIENALNKAFNPRLGMMNTKTFMSELTAGGRSLTQIYNSLGTRGTAAFAQMYGQLGKIDTGMKSVSKTTDKLFNTLGNTVRWGVIASGFQYVLNGAHSAVQYMADLDKSLTNIRMVTDESKESMRQFAQYANEAAKSLGNTTVAYTDAALIYAQQGYGLSDQKVLADYTLKVANATGQETGEVSEQMTSMINGYKLSVEEVGGALDVMAKVANTSAANLEELATASAKVASTANTLGVSQEQLVAQIATIVSVTREAPENVGNALKTIYARFGDLKLGETLEDGTDLGKVSSTLQKIGVQVLDSSGAMRDMGLIMEDLMAVWDTLDTATKQGAAVTLAGKYQYNRLMALMENSDMYEGYYDDAMSSAGTLEEMQSEYMDSLAGKANALKASFEGLLSDLFNQDDFGVVIEGLTETIDLFDQLIEAVGGGGAALTAFGAIGMNVFSNQIGRGISNIIANKEKASLAKSNVDANVANAKAQLAGAGLNSSDKNMQRFVTDTARLNQYAGIMSDEQIQRSNEMLEKRTQSLIQLDEVEKKYSQTVTGLKAAYETLGVGTEAAQQGVLGFLQTLEANDVSLEEAKNGIDHYGSALHGLQADIVAVQNALNGDKSDSTTYYEKLHSAANKLKGSLKGLRQDLIQLGVSEEQVADTTKQLQLMTEGENVSFEKLGQTLKENEVFVDHLRQSLLQLGDCSKLTAQEFEKLVSELYQARTAEHALAQEHAGLAGQMQNQAMASYFTNLTSGLMTAAFAMQSFSALTNTWANEDLSLTEKLSASWMNLLMTISMGAMAYMEITNAARTLKEAHAANTIFQALEAALNEILVKQNAKLAGATTANTAATTANTVARNANSAAATGNAAALQADTAATVANSAAKGGLLKNLIGVVGNAIKLHPVIAGLTIAFGIGAAAIQAYTYYTERFDRAIEAAQENAQRAADSLDHTTQQIKNVDSALKTIEENEKAFEGLEQGTKAWTDQLQAANDAILEIIENFPELAQFLMVDPETGALTLDPEGLENYKNELATEQAGQYAAKAQSNIRVTAAEGDKIVGTSESGLSGDDLTNLAVSISPEDFATLAAHKVNNGANYSEIEANWTALSNVLQGYGLSKDEAAEILNNENLRASIVDFISATKETEGSLQGLSQAALIQNEEFQKLSSDQQAIISDELSSWLNISDYSKLTSSQQNQLSEWGIDTNISDTRALKEYAARREDEGYVYQDGQVKKENDNGELEVVDVSVEDAYNEYIATQIGQYFKNNIDSLIPSIRETTLQALTGSSSMGFEALTPRGMAVNTLATVLENSEYSSEERVKITGMLDEDMTVEEINNTIKAINEGQSLEDIALAAGGEDALENFKTQANAAGEAKAEELDIDVDEFKAYRSLLAETNEELAEDVELLNEVAVSQKRMNRGLNTLVENWDDWNTAMTSDNLEDQSIAMGEMQDSLQDLLDLSDEDFALLPDDFAKKHWDAIQDVVNGVEGAEQRLAGIAAQEILFNLKLNEEDLATIDTAISDFVASEEYQNVEIGSTLNNQGLIDGLQDMMFTMEDGVANAQAILDTLGYTPEITYEPVTVKNNDSKTGLSTVEYVDPNTGDVVTKTVRSELLVNDEGTMMLPIINGSKVRYTGSAGAGAKKSSGGSGGGGGGGGGGSSYKPKTEKKLEDEPDRYQDVNAHLDRLSNNLDKVADEQDRLTGKALLDNMQKQVDLIQEQTDWHQKKLEIQQQEAAELRKELGADYGLTFDANGYIENYETIHQQLIDEYNALVDEYNAATTEEAQEAIKERMDELKEKIDKFNEGWERYDELMNNEIPESIKILEDLEDQIEDLRIEAFNAAVEAADNIKEVQDAWADYMGFMSGLHPDSPFRALTEDAMKYENALDSVTAKQEDLEQLMQWLPQYQPGGVITSDNPFGENSAEFYEALQTAYQSYIEAALEAEQLYYDQIDDIIEGYDDIADRIEKRMENYARLTEQLDHYASVIETLYGEEDYDNLLAIKRANQDVLESSIEQQRANLTMWQNELAKYNKETQPEIWEAIHEQVVEAEDELNGLVEEAAENTAAILEMAVDKTVKEWKDTMLGGDADWMETQWELIKQNADQYLDTVEETYELEKLRSKYNSLANDTADLNLRKRINDQMEKELAYLKEKDKLSEYDINYANAKLEILQKQIALEEAQANKNQMKLRRDSQGNYSYVYTANQDDVENARNDLLDSEFNAYSMSKENYLTNYDNYIAAISAAAEQIKAINADTLLSEEEKAERTQWIYDNLKQYLSGIAEQIGVSEQGMLESVKYLAMDSSEIVGQNYADIAAMMEENWTEALGVIGVAVSEEFDHIIHNMDEFLDKTQEKWTEFEDHTQEWADNVNDIADEGTDGFRDINDVIIDINNDMKELNEETEDFFALINDDLGTIDKAVGKLADYEKQIQGLQDSTSKVRAELAAAKAEILEKENDIRNLRDELKAEQNKNNGSDGGSGSGSGGSGGGNSDENKAASIATEALEIVKGVHYGTIANGSGGWRPSARKAGYSEDAISIALKAFNDSKTGSGYSYYYDRALELVKSYDTGGYTGAWGKEGRLAMLHQKELVLNASDTSNILAAVSAIREIVSVMKADSIGSMLSIGRNSNIAANTGSNIQQNVEIYADFPAAESAAEIKAALEGLAQQAVQYSMRTR